MKKLIIINGAMGIGKTTTCKELYKNLDNSVWLDGDWCWMINPFVANEENIEMVQKNINYLLNSFLNNSSIEYIVFNWVIHLEEIFESILKNLDNIEYEVYKITLMCSEEGLRKRIGKDVENNLRDEDCINRSLDRLKLYKDMDTIKIDTSNLTVSETVERIKEIIKG